MLQLPAKIFTLEAADIELTAGQGLEQFLVLVIEEVEATIGAARVFRLTRDLVQLVGSGGVVFHGREELQIAAVGCQQQLPQGGQAIDGFLHGGVFHLLASVAMFYLAVVLEKGDIIDRGLDSQDQAKFVVQLDRNWSHGVFDPRPFDTDVEAVTHLVLVVAVQFLSQKSGNVVRFDAVHGGACQVLIDGCQIRLPMKDDVCGVFTLIDTPSDTARPTDQRSGRSAGRTRPASGESASPANRRQSAVPVANRRSPQTRCPATRRGCSVSAAAPPASYAR